MCWGQEKRDARPLDVLCILLLCLAFWHSPTSTVTLSLRLLLYFTVVVVQVSSTFTYPLTAGVAGAPQVTSQPLSSIFLCSPLPSGTWRTPGLSIPWCCLPMSFSVCLAFFPPSLCLVRWFWPDPMKRRYDHTTAVCVSLRSSAGLRLGPLLGGWSGTSSYWEPVWPSGSALGWKAEGPRFDPLRFSFLLKKLWFTETVLWLCPQS